MRNTKTLLIEQLDQKLAPFRTTENVIVPNKGWIHAIRTALNMTLEQLGNKLHITKQGVKSIETNEAKGAITINSLKEAGEALDLKLVYGFVPKDGSIDNLITSKAVQLAQKIVYRTNHNMQLEQQGVAEEKIDTYVSDLAEEMKREMKKSLWD